MSSTTFLQWAGRAALLLLLLLVPASVANAIPSPELIVSSLSSVSQLWGLAGALAGGGVLALGARTGKSRAGEARLRRWLMVALAVACVATGTNVWQYVSAQAEQTARLEATLTRPTPKRADGKTLDPLLREMPYSKQVESPMGLTTVQIATLLGEIADGKRPEYLPLDIRETAETEQAGLGNAKPVRFPDLETAGIDFRGKTALLFCHNGNRSAETCTKLKSMGIDCRFMVGGFEKWIVDGHALAGSNARTLADLRAIAPYPNQTSLLDTGEVNTLLKERQAIFVDVRYPGEFDAGHLPGAINLPVRPTPTVKLNQMIADLPPGPVIVPCYDRRSCFFGDVMGLELSRKGREFLGRYTVPWEYFEPSTPPPHIQAWLEKAKITPFGHAARTLADTLEQAAAQLHDLGLDAGSSLAAALVLLAILSRALVWPFAAKADRDQKIARVIASDIAALKQRLADDPQRQVRAIRQLMKHHGLTPVWNLLALVFLPVLALSIEAVGLLSQQQAGKPLQPLPWISDMSAPDPVYALGIGFGVLLAGYLHLAMAHTFWQRVAVWGIAAPGLAALGAVMPAAVSFYMAVSAALLLVQRWVSSWRWQSVTAAVGRLQLSWTRWQLGDAALLSLGEGVALESCGNKAARLAVLSQAGVPVPRGVVLTHAFLTGPSWANAVQRKRALDRVWRAIASRRVAVRSSAGAEDGPHQSFAGVFDTVLDVDRAGLEAAIDRVAASFRAGRIAAYAHDQGSGNILIQPMISARFAGVVFTQDPAVPGCGRVEWVDGSGEALVSGQATPKSVRIGRLTGAIDGDAAPPASIAALWAHAMRIEARFGRPQDIEWAHDGRRLWILQARDVSASPPRLEASIADEWQRLAHLCAHAKSDPVFVADQMAELLPRPTPASLSLINALWTGGGSMDLAARSIGFAAPNFDGDASNARPLYVTAFGSIYADRRERDVRALRPRAAAIAALRSKASAIEHETRTVILPAMVARAAVLHAIDPARLSTPALMQVFTDTRDHFVRETHVAVDRINIAAHLFVEEARTALNTIGEDPIRVLRAAPQTRLRRGLHRLAASAAPWPLPVVRDLLGHRATVDYELATPRYGENEADLFSVARDQIAMAPDARPHIERARWPKPTRRMVVRAQRFITLKEDAKHESLREVAVLRQLMLEIDRRFDLGGTVWQLSLDDVAGLGGVGGLARVRAMLAKRQAMAAALICAPPLPAELTRRWIERGPLAANELPGAPAQVGPDAPHGVLRSTRVSGHTSVVGRAIRVASEICNSGQPIPGFEPGDIIVARSMHPAWLPQMLQSGGVIVETGGWLSHMAILARERGLPMSVNARGIDRIQTGMRLRLDTDGSVVCL